MINALKRPLLLLLAACLCSAAVAGRVDDLYKGREAVAEQSPATLRRGAASALEQVFVRVSGQGQLPQSSALSEALASPEPFLTRYSYRRENTDGEERLWLDMKFSPRQVNAVLQSAGLPVWSANRPTVLLWLVVDTPEGRSFLGSGSHPDLEKALQDAVARRGLALQLPLFDLIDAGNMSAQALWQMPEGRAAKLATLCAALHSMGRFPIVHWPVVGELGLLDEQSGERFDTQSQQDSGFLAAAVDQVPMFKRVATRSTVLPVPVGAR